MHSVIYLHGLNSSGQSHKAGLLRERLAPVPLRAPDYPAHRPEEAVGVLAQVLDGLDGAPVVLVGSSMGGFYGQYLAREYPVAHLFMINPALRPWELLPDFLDRPQVTAHGEEYLITPALVELTRPFGIDRPCAGSSMVPTTLFLDQGDEVIDYRIAEAMYRDCGRVLAYFGGDHAFQHLNEAIAIIRAELGLSDG